MKPEFTLSLSFEGIRVLHRTDAGWVLVGEVALDDADMPGALSALRAEADRLESPDALCKILVPNSQIRYMTIESPGADTKARRAAAAKALEGATPYAVSDLIYDISADGDETHIAAVARETLTEAEAFAVEHGFRPVSFVAAPEENDFGGEPFFGVTRAAVSLLSPGEQVEPDTTPVTLSASGGETAQPDPQETPAPEPDSVPDRFRPETPDETQPDEPATTPQPDDPAPAEPPSEAPDRDPEEVPDRTPEPDQPDGPRERPPSEPEPAPQPSDPEGPDTPTEVPTPQAPPEAPQPQTPTEVPQMPNTGMAPPSADEQARLLAEFRTVATAVGHASLSQQKTAAAEDSDIAPATPAPVSKRPDAPIGPEAAFASLRGPARPVEDEGPETSEDRDDAEAPAFVLPSLGGASRRADTSAGASPALSASRDEKGAQPFASRRGKPGGDSPARVEPNLTAGAAAHGTPAPSAAKAALSHATAPQPDDAGKPDAVAAFAARHGAGKAKPKADVAKSEKPRTALTEAERMTVFGARQTEVGGKPRFLGLMLTTGLLVFLAGVAAWASVFFDDGLDLSRLFGDREPRIVEPGPISTTDGQILPARPRVRAPEGADEPATLASLPPQEKPVEAPAATPKEPEPEILAAIEPESLADVPSQIETLRSPAPSSAPLTETQLEAKYATTGIWPRAPQTPPDPAEVIDIEDLYITSIDPVSTSTDAVALPPLDSFVSDVVMAGLSSPAAPGTQFTLDERGLVEPSEKGALTPDGILVYRGKPPVVPPAPPERTEEAPAPPEALRALALTRPQVRPSDLSETNERAQNDGLTRAELAGFRPALRPPSQQQQAAVTTAPAVKLEETDAAVTVALASPPAIQNATDQATVISRRPDSRPHNFARTVEKAERAQPTRVAAVAPRTVAPSIPSKTTVAKQATVRDAINLRKVNLIGVYGKPSSRRALIRLGNGRYQKVVVGDRIDGGRVSAIGDSELRYRKRGRDVVLTIPQG